MRESPACTRRVVQACAEGRIGQAATDLLDSADGLLRAVRAAVGEGQRLMKADHVGLGIAVIAARNRLGLDLVESLLVIEQLDHRPAAIRPLDGELTAE